MGLSLSSVFGGGGGGPQYAQTTQTKSPGEFSPWIYDALNQGQTLYNGQGPQYSNLYGGLSANTQAGINELGAYAPTTSDAASGMVTKTLNGDYLDPNSNPWLKQTYNTAGDNFEAQLRSRFGATGSGDSSAFMGSAGQGMADLAGNIYGGNYQNERARQMQAAGLAPSVDQGRMQGAYAKLQGGAVQDQDTLQRLTEQNRQANFGYEGQWEKLARYLGVIEPATNGYGSATTQSPYFRNKGAGVLGGALGGASIGGAFNSHDENGRTTGFPYGTLIGAIGGGILGGSG